MRKVNPNFEIVDSQMAEILRALTPQQRLAIGNDMWVFARDLLRESVRGVHPEWTEEQVNQEAARKMLHDEIDPEIVTRTNAQLGVFASGRLAAGRET